MRQARARRPRHTTLAPLAAPPRRAVVEGAVGCAALLVLATLVRGEAGNAFTTPAGAVALALAAGVWLICWPALRLRRLRGDSRRRRLGLSIGRALLCGLLLGLAQLVLDAWLWPPADPSLVTRDTATFVGVRLVVVIAAALLRRARRRLRWQLTASHLAVILLTFATITALGSTIAVNLVFVLLRPDAGMMATSVADWLRLADPTAPLEPTRTARLLSAIEQPGRLPLRGQSFLATLSAMHVNAWKGGPTGLVVPVRVMIVSADGRVLAAAAAPYQAALFHIPRAMAPLPASVWGPLRRQVLAGRSATMAGQAIVNAHLTPGGQSIPVESLTGAAPIRDSAGRPLAAAVVQVLQIAPLPPILLLPGIFTAFLVTTLLLVLALTVPVLGISGLFGYALARGLTRRLEAVSRVTTAIAAGNLTVRVPVTAENEVGRLADDVNRMAAHLETAVGALQEARRQAEEALRARQELVASISHELRTPLAIVRAHLETLLLRHPVAPGGTPHAEADVAVPASTLHALQNETERLAGLVDDLFALSRAQSGALEIHCQRVDVAALIGEIAALMRPLAQREGMIALSVETMPGLPPALADPDRLRQILENLVRNAVRHTPDGGIIVLSATVEEPWIVVAVADTGEGIPPEHLPHIFERFYRVEQARTRSGGGAGLGLAIVREFVELMGGHVTVESVPGEGSCFRVFLPPAPPAS